MEKSLQELADMLGGRCVGDPLVQIRGLATLDTAGEGQISFLANPKYAARVATTNASAVVLSPGANTFGRNAIVLANPYLAFAKLLTIFTTRPRVARGVMPGAVVGGIALLPVRDQEGESGGGNNKGEACCDGAGIGEAQGAVGICGTGRKH